MRRISSPRSRPQYLSWRFTLGVYQANAAQENAACCAVHSELVVRNPPDSHTYSDSLIIENDGWYRIDTVKSPAGHYSREVTPETGLELPRPLAVGDPTELQHAEEPFKYRKLVVRCIPKDVVINVLKCMCQPAPHPLETLPGSLRAIATSFTELVEPGQNRVVLVVQLNKCLLYVLNVLDQGPELVPILVKDVFAHLSADRSGASDVD